MGRWAQRSIRGGGPPAGATLIQIDRLELQSNTEVAAIYTANVTAGDFNVTDFDSSPSAQNPTNIDQFDVNALLLTFDDPIDADVDLTYSGNVAAVLTPQTVSY